ncbi:sugar ABC transporter permease [Actinoplanes couchii]|uniref:Sugar ABC transporter permease n=1 Tax=Actinoplanes couchii TaxID=403638 RepID=A0ABQ3WZB9_9ACTN|nr:sugar ABC transporter permease [Actinoplanes couchii]MDR6316010.1 ABC-type sugar transport system permease subunit [Actinoplanes couchii]GID51624.1 hypothetical protein Aco03nite_000280 [Actinoplanes couchii]
MGFLLIIPAFLALLISYVAPSIKTAWDSFHDGNVFSDGSAEGAGLENYSRIAEDGFFGGLGYAALLALLPVITMCVAGALLAWLTHRGGTVVRRSVRLALAVPMVLISPVGMAGAWMLLRGGGGPVAVMLAFWLSLYGLFIGVGVTLFLAALRRPEQSRRQVTAVIAVGVVAGIAVLAFSLQTFYFQTGLTLGRSDGWQTPLSFAYTRTFQLFDIGPAAAANTVLGIVLGLLGLVAVAVLAASRLRGDVLPAREIPSRPFAAGWAVGAYVLLAAALVTVVVGVWPWLSELAGYLDGQRISTDPPEGAVTVQTWVNTWLPALFPTVVGVLLAALGGYGIGVLRPLGRHSEWLLLLFAPWLFVSLGPLAGTWFFWFNDAELTGSWLTLIPPVWLNIPALVIFTLLFHGLAERRAARGGSLGRAVIVPALPMLAVVGGLTYLVHVQNIHWQLITATDKSLYTLPLVAQMIRTTFIGAAGTALPIITVILSAAILGALQWFYLDRVSLRTDTGDGEQR